MLRLIAAGRTNTQIGTELFISASTAGVHVDNLRNLGAANGAEAAATAERAGLLDEADERPGSRIVTGVGCVTVP